MRLWHRDLLPVLPRQQLLSQWRECCCIAKNIADNGTPNHILVNKIMCYSMDDFWNYTRLVTEEMRRRGYKVNIDNFTKHYYKFGHPLPDPNNKPFVGWHNDRYLQQCLFNLQEKFDCGGIPHDEWTKICRAYKRELTPQGSHLTEILDHDEDYDKHSPYQEWLRLVRNTKE